MPLPARVTGVPSTVWYGPPASAVGGSGIAGSAAASRSIRGVVTSLPPLGYVTGTPVSRNAARICAVLCPGRAAESTANAPATCGAADRGAVEAGPAVVRHRRVDVRAGGEQVEQRTPVAEVGDRVAVGGRADGDRGGDAPRRPDCGTVPVVAGRDHRHDAVVQQVVDGDLEGVVVADAGELAAAQAHVHRGDVVPAADVGDPLQGGELVGRVPRARRARCRRSRRRR